MRVKKKKITKWFYGQKIEFSYILFFVICLVWFFLLFVSFSEKCSLFISVNVLKIELPTKNIILNID